MQPPLPPMAQNCQMITAHSSSATGKATTKPFAKPIRLGDRTTLASDTLDCRLFISVKSGIAGLLSNKGELIMTYLCETFITTQVRQTGIFARRNAALSTLQSGAAAAASTRFRSVTKSQMMQLIKPTIRRMSEPFASGHRSPRQSSRRDAPSSRHDMPQGSAAAEFKKLGDRK